jgi:mRNA interferase RelE/StbE
MKKSMSSLRIIISSTAEKQLRKISKTDQIALARKIRLISQSPEITGEEKLSGFKNIYRVRIGDYRIVYKKTLNLIYIVLIAHRKDIYQLLKHWLG